MCALPTLLIIHIDQIIVINTKKNDFELVSEVPEKQKLFILLFADVGSSKCSN